MGIEVPEAFGGAGGALLPRRARRRGTVARRSVDRRARGRAEHARHQRAAPLGQRRAEGAAPAATGLDDASAPTPCRRPARAATRSRCRRARAETATASCSAGPQALDHQRQRGGHLHRVRDRQPRGRLPRHHRVPRRARHAGLHGRQEGRQARHPRVEHVRAALRGLPRAARATCSARSARATRSRSRR